MKPFWTTVVLVVSLCVCGCAPTPYQRASTAFRHGFDDTEFSDDMFHVAFTANYTTPASTLLEYLYRRAADLTLQHKFRYFAVVREPRPRANYKVIYRYQADQGAGIDAQEVEVPARGTLHMTIQCFQDDWQAADMQPIDATAHLPMSRRSRPLVSRAAVLAPIFAPWVPLSIVRDPHVIGHCLAPPPVASYPFIGRHTTWRCRFSSFQEE